MTDDPFVVLTCMLLASPSTFAYRPLISDVHLSSFFAPSREPFWPEFSRIPLRALRRVDASFDYIRYTEAAPGLTLPLPRGMKIVQDPTHQFSYP